MTLPEPRGPLSHHLLEHLVQAPHNFSSPPPQGDPIAGEDFHLALYLSYELHYRGLPEISEAWEWHPSLITFQRSLEAAFEDALYARIRIEPAAEDIADQLRALTETESGPSLADYMRFNSTLEEFRAFVVHRSAYQLKEADPHSWVIPRLSGRAKAALVEIQADEYGSGSAECIHARLFATTMESLGLDSRYGAYVNRLPGVTLSTVNLMSMFGLHRRWRGAAVGHLAVFEMTSSIPNGKYASGLRRLGAEAATEFFDEHVEADAAHEMIAVHDMAAALAEDEPAVAKDILFGARALVELDAAFARHLMSSWAVGKSSFYSSSADALSVP
ncbi:MAG: iron-containing redox enzyme family protein [Actinomycetota bacterium]|nr:iron-containing redox enzyme family protein [Actinomycetota bacterium]